MDAELKSLIVAAVVWLLFIFLGLFQFPIKVSPIISVGGGFLVSAVVLFISHVFFSVGFLGFAAIAILGWLLWGALDRITGK